MSVFSCRFYCIKYIILLLTLSSVVYALLCESSANFSKLQSSIQSVELLCYSCTLALSYLVSARHSFKLLVMSLAFLCLSLVLSLSAMLVYMALSIETITSWVANIFIFLNSLLEFSLLLITRKRVNIKKITPHKITRVSTLRQWEMMRRKADDLKMGLNESKESEKSSVSNPSSREKSKNSSSFRRAF